MWFAIENNFDKIKIHSITYTTVVMFTDMIIIIIIIIINSS